MKRLMAMAFLLGGLGIPWWTDAAAADDLTSTDATAIHETVQSQLEALSNDDAAGAFELATPEKRLLIGSPDNFLRLIKEQYNPLYHYQRVLFSNPQIIDGDAVQLVRVTDDASHVWLAIFWMQQGEDKSWKIDGCQLLQTASMSV